MHAERIFTGGRVHTVNARNDIVEAVAVGGGGRGAAGRLGGARAGQVGEEGGPSSGSAA